MVEIAEDRTQGFQSAFINAGARASDVATFARSCYIQGIHDAADAMLQHQRKQKEIVP